MNRPIPWSEQIDVILSDESSSDADVEVNDTVDIQQLSNIGVHQPTNEMTFEGVDVRQLSKIAIDQPTKEMTSEGMLIRRSEIYQEYMKQIPIPAHRGSVIPFSSWVGLGKSIKQLYGQPLHYLTNILLKQWDQMRIGSEDEHQPLDGMVHPCKAEATVWLVEEVHRRTSSPHHLAKLWLSDPMHHAFVDSIFPQL